MQAKSISKSNKCLIGVIMIQIAQALLVTWGKCNIYYYSYYKHLDPDLDFSLNTIVISIMAIPLVVISIFSLRIAERITHSVLIRLCALVQLLSLTLAPFMPSYELFILFFLVLNGFAYALIAYPLLGCVWSHFGRSEGKVTGTVIAAFTFASLFFMLLITMLCNPYNREASLSVKMGQQYYRYFSFEEVGANVPVACFIVGLISGTLSVIGSSLISLKKHRDSELDQDTSIQPIKVIEMEEIGILKESQNLDLELVEKIKEQENDQIQVQQAIRSPQFIIMFIAQFFLMFFMVTLGMNFKSYALSKINNDYLLTLADTVTLILAGASSLIWGRLVDQVNFSHYFSLIFFMDGCAIILMALIDGKIIFVIFYGVVSLFDKGAMIIMGPGLVKIYGNKTGTQLFAILNSGSMLSLILAPLFQMYATRYISFDAVLAWCGVFLLFSSLLNFFFNLMKRQ